MDMYFPFVRGTPRIRLIMLFFLQNTSAKSWNFWGKVGGMVMEENRLWDSFLGCSIQFWQYEPQEVYSPLILKNEGLCCCNHRNPRITGRNEESIGDRTISSLWSAPTWRVTVVVLISTMSFPNGCPWFGNKRNVIILGNSMIQEYPLCS